MLCAIAFLMAGCASGGMSKKEKQGDIYAQAGSEALMKGDFSDALGSLKEAVKLQPKSEANWSNLGLAYAGKEDFVRAESCWKKALDINPEYSDARLNLGALYFRQKKLAAAEKTFKEVLKDLSYEKGPQVKYNLGLLYASQGKQLLAQQYFKLAVKEDEAYCPAWFQLAHLQSEKGEMADAAKSYKKAVSGSCFSNPRAHYELGSLYIKAREPALAKSKLLEVIKFFPDSDWAKKAEITLNSIR